MYTIAPIPDIQVSYFMVYFGYFLVLCGIYFFGANLYDKQLGNGIASLAVCSVAAALFIVIGYHTVVRENKQVVGTFVRYMAEGYEERSGKTRTERHVIYVIYEINGSQVPFPASTGVAYPPKAVFYKN